MRVGSTLMGGEIVDGRDFSENSTVGNPFESQNVISNVCGSYVKRD